MIEFHNVRITGKFRYLWLKYVTGYNLSVHCARSLEGEYSKRIGTELRTADLIKFDEHNARVIYLCGVSLPYNWENNFHLAVREMPGRSFDVDQLGIAMHVENAIPLPIETASMESVNHPKLSLQSYSTCRNWQFANFLHVTRIHEA